MSFHKFAPTFVRITLHYAVIVLVLMGMNTLFPGIRDFLPVGALDHLFEVVREPKPDGLHYSKRLQEVSYTGRALFIFMCFLTSIVVSLPVGRTYIGTHSLKRRNSSMAKALLVLPVAVAGLVIIVQNDLALAFSLAGIVAGCGIRFRTNIREFTDTIYFMVAIGIGLAAGTGALGIAFVMSLVFCYTILVVFSVGYGEDPGTAMPEDGPVESEGPEYEL
jgi:hypothetical protein